MLGKNSYLKTLIDRFARGPWFGFARFGVGLR
jgi:hypothetical protein